VLKLNDCIIGLDGRVNAEAPAMSSVAVARLHFMFVEVDTIIGFECCVCAELVLVVGPS
jgi:hypothetical protein